MRQPPCGLGLRIARPKHGAIVRRAQADKEGHGAEADIGSYGFTVDRALIAIRLLRSQCYALTALVG
jgi:hypothetical protein